MWPRDYRAQEIHTIRNMAETHIRYGFVYIDENYNLTKGEISFTKHNQADHRRFIEEIAVSKRWDLISFDPM